MNNDKHEFHRRSIRVRGYDYSEGGPYFITVCATARKSIFGEILDGQVNLKPWGKVVLACWQEIPDHFPQVELDEFVVMPNHVHGIVTIAGRHGRGMACHAPTTGVGEFGKPKAGSLPTIIGAFKSATTKRIHQLFKSPDTAIWQRNYYEHIIRDEKSLNRIREYLHYNPLRWALDRENPDRQGEDEFDRWLDSYKNLPERNGTFFKGRGMTGHALTEDEGD